ncbi:MAG: hypothetical protein AMJ42_02620 [Deltaproteobacteria bacterium DG_8]|nr:MAG: hypothetical protein AMJ42_02620 [Deltaproteobacteria bacterium DG_8]
MGQESFLVKLNIGCGPQYKEGWINIDRESPCDVKTNLLEGLPFKDGCCDIAFLSHLLEHFSYQEARDFLVECNRISKIGALIRIIVPDLEIFARKYVEKDKAFYNQPGPHNGFRFKGDTLGDKFMYVAISGGHKYFYDFDSLRNLLLTCGFGNVVKSGFGNSKIEGISLLDNRPEVSLFIEAQKVKVVRSFRTLQNLPQYRKALWKRGIKKVLRLIAIR